MTSFEIILCFFFSFLLLVVVGFWRTEIQNSKYWKREYDKLKQENLFMFKELLNKQ